MKNMYSNFRSVQILISLLKKFGIQDIVLSPGGSDIPLIHSIETDEFFTCYSVVDERSAAYFAMGVAQQKNRPSACICTSGTAVPNYLPAITEAWYQSVPVLAITADKNPYFQGQLETQKIDQTHTFDGVVKKSVSLPLIHIAEDEWLCNRLVNEALLELTHHGTGPVHINIPIVGATDVYNCETLPNERKITIVDFMSSENTWAYYAKQMENKKIMVVVGQNVIFSQEDVEALECFYKTTNSIFSVENISNLNCNGCVFTYRYTETHGITSEELIPDIVISIGNNLAAYSLKPVLRQNYKKIENWLISEKGEVRDAYKCLSTIFECDAVSFFKKIFSYYTTNDNQHSYFNKWTEAVKKIELPEFEFSNFYVAKKLAKVIPENSVLHLAILNSTRVMQFFDLNDNVRTYSNVGGLGIDGCMSTFMGQAASTDSLCYLVVGDLSFFYDMNAAGLRNIGNNVRIILLNNCGGAEFHFFMGKEKIPTINCHICAEHSTVAAGWIKSLNYDYFCADTQEEFDHVIEAFGKPSDKPMFLEVITDMEADANQTRAFYKSYNISSSSSRAKQVVKKILSDDQISKIKEIIKIVRR